MSALFALLSQQTPSLQTNKALIVLGLQNEFVSPHGKLPVHDTQFLDRLFCLVPTFRQYGTVVWIRTEYQANRPVNDEDNSEDYLVLDTGVAPPTSPSTSRRKASAPNKNAHRSKRARTAAPQASKTTTVDDELFLTNTATHPAGCIPSTVGADYCDRVQAEKRPTDFDLVKSHYSAFVSTSLLVTLRSKLITEVFLCGCLTNLSVYATAMDAARYGIKITVVDDCLGYRRRDRHEFALTRLRDHVEAELMSSRDVSDLLLKSAHAATTRSPTVPRPSDAITTQALPGLIPNDDSPGTSARWLANVLEVDDDEDDYDGDDHVTDHDDNRINDRKCNQHQERRHDDPSWLYPLNQDMHALQLSSRNTSPVQPKARIASNLSTTTRYTSLPASASSPSSSSTSVSNARGGQYSWPQTSLADQAESYASPSAAIMRAVAAASGRSISERRRWLAKCRILDGDNPVDGQPPERRSMAAFQAITGVDQVAVREWEVAMREKRGEQERLDHEHRGYPVSPATIASGATATTIAVDNQDYNDDDYHNTTLSGPLPARCESQWLFGPDSREASAGSRIFHNVLPPELNTDIFSKLETEITWNRMLHQTGAVPRLVSCQGTVVVRKNSATNSDGSSTATITTTTRPVYRHPADRTLAAQPWTPKVDAVRRAAERIVGHPLNHALIQLYRDGADYISEHSDKTLDIARGSRIVNVSIGAQRTMRLRSKRTAVAAAAPSPPGSPTSRDPVTTVGAARTIHRVPLPHGSLVAMTPATNAAYLHAVPADRRPAAERAAVERGARISLTFRHIATFVSENETNEVGDTGTGGDVHGATVIWGQGATGKRREEARPVIVANGPAGEALVRAFGKENRMDVVDWEGCYGEGSDVLHLR